MPTKSLEDRYVSDSVVTAGPATSVVMLYERLLDDMAVAVAAIDAKDFKLVHMSLVHAQEILRLLRTSLRPEIWPDAGKLANLYFYFERELIEANISHDKERVASIYGMVEKLTSAWKIAAEKCVSEISSTNATETGGYLA